MNTVIRFFVVFGSAIAFANVTPVSAGGSKDNDPEITAALNKAEKLVESNQQPADNSIGSFLDNLLNSVKGLLSSVITGYLRLLPNLIDGITCAIENDSNGGLIELLGDISSGLILAFEATTAESVFNGLTNFDSDSDSKQNALIRKDIGDALALSEQDAQNSDVLDLVKFFLKGIVAMVGSNLGPALISTVNGLVTGLVEGLHKDGLLGGVLCGFGGLAEGLNTGLKEGYLGFLTTLLT